jgi:hypothetical protein
MKINTRSLVSTLSSLTFLGAVLSTATGCGALSAMGNPKVAWAVTDPAPMSIVVRRADAAQATTVQVDRLLTATPTGADSDWLAKVAPDPAEAAGDMKALSQDPMYMKSHARVVASEVWIRTLPGVQSGGGDHPNLLSAIDQSLGDQYADIMTKKQEIGALAAQIEEEKSAADAKDASPDDKKNHSDAAAKLAKTKSDKESEVSPLQKTFLASVKTMAAKVPADQQAKFTPAVLNLLAALDDADIANGAAAVRFPLAIRSMGDSIKEVVPVLAADVVEEKTGNRPIPANIHADVTLNGSSVAVTLTGIAPADLGSLDMGDLTKEVITRAGKWVLHATTILGTVNSTKETLNFEHDALSQIMAGFAPPPATLIVFKVPAADSKEVMAAVPSVHMSLTAKAHVAVAAPPVVAETSLTSASATVGVKGGAKGGAAATAATAKKDPKDAAKPAPAKAGGKSDKKSDSK